MKVMIYHVPTSITQNDIRELCEPYGTISSVHIMQDKHTGLPNGAVCVIMESQEAGDMIIANLNGLEYKGQVLHVGQADEAEFPTNNFW